MPEAWWTTKRKSEPASSSAPSIPGGAPAAHARGRKVGLEYRLIMLVGVDGRPLAQGVLQFFDHVAHRVGAADRAPRHIAGHEHDAGAGHGHDLGAALAEARWYRRRVRSGLESSHNTQEARPAHGSGSPTSGQTDAWG